MPPDTRLQRKEKHRAVCALPGIVNIQHRTYRSGQRITKRPTSSERVIRPYAEIIVIRTHAVIPTNAQHWKERKRHEYD